MMLGELMGKNINHEHFDLIVPIPDTSRTYAIGLSNYLNIPIKIISLGPERNQTIIR